MHFRALFLLCFFPLLSPVVFGAASSDSFPGWEGVRVIHQPSRAQILRAGDVFGDGREELIVVNTRQSRLDVYRWRDEEESEPVAFDPERPNELPMAPEFEVLELPLEELPRDVVLHSVDPEFGQDIFILVGPPNRLVQYRASETESSGWEEKAAWDLLPGSVRGANPLLLRGSGQETTAEMLIGFEEGIQRVRLENGSRVKWFQPKERRNRRDWWTADLTGEGESGVLEWVRSGGQTLRWYQQGNAELLPARSLSDRSFRAMEVLSLGGSPDELLLLGGTQEGILRRYRVERDEPSPVGSQQMLTLGGRSVWTGIQLEDGPRLVVSSGGQPRLEVFSLTGKGWSAEGDFPALRGIQALAAPVAEPGTLLLWAEDAQDLYASHWKNDRLTYPVAFPQSADVEDRRIVALSHTGDTVWWAQTVEGDLDVYHWPPDASEAIRTRFPGLGGEYSGVNRLGKRTLLLMESYARNPRLAVLEESGEVTVSEPPRLRRSRLDEFFPVVVEQEHRIGRLTEGIWQWLDESLQTRDQIMLPQGLQMAAYLPLPEGEAWVLEQGGRTLHHMVPDEAGIPRAEERYKLPGGSRLIDDPFLGMLLYDDDQIVRLAPGEPWHLALAESIDSRVGRPTGVREATIHRLFTTDLTGDGRQEVIFSDDRRHYLTALNLQGEKLEPLISWQVFEDRSYPYGVNEGRGATVEEPRTLIGLDIDGDGRQDLAMLSHDRLVIYLAREPNKKETDVYAEE